MMKSTNLKAGLFKTKVTIYILGNNKQRTWKQNYLNLKVKIRLSVKSFVLFIQPSYDSTYMLFHLFVNVFADF